MTPIPTRPFDKLNVLLLVALLVLLWAPATPAGAQARIEVLVNNDPVTTYDIDNRARLLKLTTGGRAGRTQALEELIDERLKMQEAQRRNVTASQSEIDEAFASIASRAKMSPSRLEAALRQSGVNPRTLKERLQAEIVWSQIVRARFRATVEISERDVAKAMGGEDAATESISEFRIQEIIFIIPAKSSNAYIAQRKREAEAFRSRYGGCDGALAQAKGLKNVVVKPTIRREETQLSDNMVDALNATETGKASQPIRSRDGYTVLGVCDRTSIQGASKASAETRQTLANERGQMLARRYLRDLRADAVIIRR